jgi:hypothetical protein
MKLRFAARVDAAEKRINIANRHCAEALAAMFRDALKQTSQRHPGKIVRGRVTNGVWCANMPSPEIIEVLGRFQQMKHAYGPETIPTPLVLAALDGKIITEG